MRHSINDLSEAEKNTVLASVFQSGTDPSNSLDVIKINAELALGEAMDRAIIDEAVQFINTEASSGRMPHPSTYHAKETPKTPLDDKWGDSDNLFKQVTTQGKAMEYAVDLAKHSGLSGDNFDPDVFNDKFQERLGFTLSPQQTAQVQDYLQSPTEVVEKQVWNGPYSEMKQVTIDKLTGEEV